MEGMNALGVLRTKVDGSEGVWASDYAMEKWPKKERAQEHTEFKRCVLPLQISVIANIKTK